MSRSSVELEWYEGIDSVLLVMYADMNESRELAKVVLMVSRVIEMLVDISCSSETVTGLLVDVDSMSDIADALE